MMQTVQRVPQPVIAQVHGVAAAAGCQLVAACDLAIAADTARFFTPGVRIGLFCSTPMVALSRAVGRKRALEMLLTGAPIDAPTAADWGLINRAVPEAELDAAVAELVEAGRDRQPADDGDRQAGVLRADRPRPGRRLRAHERDDGHQRDDVRRPGGHLRLPGQAHADLDGDLAHTATGWASPACAASRCALESRVRIRTRDRIAPMIAKPAPTRNAYWKPSVSAHRRRGRRRP